jgi:hypothetical protein
MFLFCADSFHPISTSQDTRGKYRVWYFHLTRKKSQCLQVLLSCANHPANENPVSSCFFGYPNGHHVRQLARQVSLVCSTLKRLFIWGKPRADPVYGKSTFVITFYSISFCIYMGIKLACLRVSRWGGGGGWKTENGKNFNGKKK